MAAQADIIDNIGKGFIGDQPVFGSCKGEQVLGWPGTAIGVVGIANNNHVCTRCLIHAADSTYRMPRRFPDAGMFGVGGADDGDLGCAVLLHAKRCQRKYQRLHARGKGDVAGLRCIVMLCAGGKGVLHIGVIRKMVIKRAVNGGKGIRVGGNTGREVNQWARCMRKTHGDFRQVATVLRIVMVCFIVAHMFFTLFFACLFDAVFGYPKWLYERIRHPVVWMGALIALLEEKFNQERFSKNQRRLLGAITVKILIAVTLFIACVVAKIRILNVIAMASLLAGRSLYEHVDDVAEAVTSKDLPAARTAVGKIVGRDVEDLDESGVCRAAIESLAESFSDGVVAPFFWAAVLGLPGIACYKMINTADSMIGHKTERYGDFGWAAAKLDDLSNWIPARLSGFLIVLAARSHAAFYIMCNDARNHSSPNAGWPEAAMAGALGVTLGGANMYDGVPHPAPTMGTGEAPTPAHLLRAIHLYVSAYLMLALALLALALFL